MHCGGIFRIIMLVIMKHALRSMCIILWQNHDKHRIVTKIWQQQLTQLSYIGYSSLEKAWPHSIPAAKKKEDTNLNILQSLFCLYSYYVKEIIKWYSMEIFVPKKTRKEICIFYNNEVKRKTPQFQKAWSYKGCFTWCCNGYFAWLDMYLTSLC